MKGLSLGKWRKRGKNSERVEKNRQINKENYKNQVSKKEDTFEITSEKIIASITYEEKKRTKRNCKRTESLCEL